MTDHPIRTRNVKSRAEVLEALKAALDLRMERLLLEEAGPAGWLDCFHLPTGG
jgi:hypothetical protein